MNGGEMFLLLLGPVFALAAGLAIYGTAVRARPPASVAPPTDRH